MPYITPTEESNLHGRMDKLEWLLEKFTHLELPDGNPECQKAKENLLRLCPEFLGYINQAKELL